MHSNEGMKTLEVALDPGGHVFYAGSRDGKIYIAALNAESSPSKSYGLHIIGSLSDHSKPVTCLAYIAEGDLLLSGSEDGLFRVWNVKTHTIIHMFRHAKGPIDNILIVRHPLPLGRAVSKAQASAMHELLFPPPLEKYANSTDEGMVNKPIITLPATSNLPSYLSSQLIDNHIKELQQQGSSDGNGETEA